MINKKLLTSLLTLIIIVPLYADEVLNNALKRAIAQNNFPLAVALYQQAVNQTVDGEVLEGIRHHFERKFGQKIDDAVKPLTAFNAQLKAANGNEEQLKKVYVDLLTNPTQPGGKIAQKLGISGQLAGALK